MIYSNVGYCRCGFEVWIEYLWNGNQWRQRFTDQENNELTRCLECGAILSDDTLESK
jgi:RNase P subunit RPR2